jgi:hypothetical protein
MVRPTAAEVPPEIADDYRVATRIAGLRTRGGHLGSTSS